MSTRSSDRSKSGIGDVFRFAGYIQVSSDKSMDDCILGIRENQTNAPFMGGYTTRMILPKATQSRKPNQPYHFGMEYYRLSYRSGRPTHAVQQLRGVLYTENNQTHIAAKVQFTGAALRWFWLALMLVLLSIGVWLYTGNVVLIGLVALTGIPLLVLIIVMWLDRYYLRRIIRRGMGVQ